MSAQAPRPVSSWHWLTGCRWTRWTVVQKRFVYLGGLFTAASMVGKEGVAEFQRRECLDCGKVQEEELP